MSDVDQSDLNAWEQGYRRQLAAHVASMDPAIRARLARARQRALAEGLESAQSRAFRVPGAWLPAGVLAVAATLALAVWVSRPVPSPAPSAEVAAVEDVELLASGEEPDFYAEDPAFYEWAGTENGAS